MSLTPPPTPFTPTANNNINNNANRHTKLVSLKPKYMIENQTGLAMVMKQAGTQDPDTWAPDPARFARVLSPGNR
jgi:hypothetical protein